MAKKRTALATKKISRSKTKIVPNGPVSVDINRVIPPGLPVQFANHFVVQHENAVFHMLFFQVESPILVGDSAETQRALANLKSVDAQCVARIVLPADQMPQIIEALISNFQKQQAAMADGTKPIIIAK